MKKPNILYYTVGVFIVGFLFVIYYQNKPLASTPQIQNEIKATSTSDLNFQEKLGQTKQIASLEQQEQCAEYTKKYFNDNGYEIKDTVGTLYFSYVSHYNIKLNKCFIFITNSDINSNALFLYLIDAVEGKTYGEFDGHPFCNFGNESNLCRIDSGSIWSDGNSSKDPDLHFGFSGLGKQSGDVNTQKEFTASIQSFLNE